MPLHFTPGLARLAAVGWTLLVCVLLLMPGGDMPSVSVVSADKLIHAVLFAVGTWLWIRAFPNRALLVLVAAFVLAVVTELAQDWLGWGRATEFGDAVADIVGALAAYAWTRFRRVPQRAEREA
jgi:hypothetical protein